MDRPLCEIPLFSQRSGSLDFLLTKQEYAILSEIVIRPIETTADAEQLDDLQVDAWGMMIAV